MKPACSCLRYVNVKKMFNRGKAHKLPGGKNYRFHASVKVKRRAVDMLHNGDSFEKIRRIVWDLTNEKVWQRVNIMYTYIFSADFHIQANASSTSAIALPPGCLRA